MLENGRLFLAVSLVIQQNSALRLFKLNFVLVMSCYIEKQNCKSLEIEKCTALTDLFLNFWPLGISSGSELIPEFPGIIKAWLLAPCLAP